MFKRMVLPAVVTVTVLYGGMVMAASVASGDSPGGYSVNIAQDLDKDQDQDTSTSRDNNTNENDKNSKKHKCCEVKAG